MEQNINNHFTSTEPNSNIDISLFDVAEFEKEREELDEKKDHYFQQQQRIVIVFVYEDIFCEIEECDWKRYNIIHNTFGIFCLRKNVHQMVLNVLKEFLHCKLSKIQYTGEQKKELDDDKIFLSIKSAECKIIANVMEDGHGLINAWQFVNGFNKKILNI